MMCGMGNFVVYNMSFVYNLSRRIVYTFDDLDFISAMDDRESFIIKIKANRWVLSSCTAGSSQDPPIHDV